MRRKPKQIDVAASLERLAGSARQSLGAILGNMTSNPNQPRAGSPGGKANEAALEQFVDLFELAPIAYLSIAADRTIRRVNCAAADLLGCDGESLSGLDFGLFVADDARAEFDEFLAKLRATGAVQILHSDLAGGDATPVAVVMTARTGRGEGECLLAIAESGKAQQAAERSLRALQARARSLNKMSPNFYWETDAEHRITHMSLLSRQTGRTYLKHAPGIGMRRWEAPYLSPGEAQWEAHRAVLAARQPFRNFELSRLGLDGAEYHFSISGDPVFDESGAFTGYHGLGRDISERKQADKTLRESEERYRSLFANAGDGILILSGDGSIIAANETFARMHGYSVAEVLKLTVKDLLVPQAWELAPERWRRVLEGESLTLEIDHYHKAGHVFTVEVTSKRVLLGNVTYMQTFHRDVTERRRAEATLRQSEARYRSLFAEAGHGIVILSPDRRITAYNEAFARMHGYSVQEMAGLGLKDLLAPATYAAGPEQWRRTLAEERITLEVEHIHKDGHAFPVEVSASLIHVGDDVLMQTFHRDITERKNAEVALVAAIRAADSANRAKTRFLAAASHDLRQPVQAINLFLDALAQTELRGEQEEILRYLGMSVRGLRELLNALLDISQLDAGVVRPEVKTVSAEQLLRELYNEFALIARGKNLHFRFLAAKDLPLITDPSLVLRALRNIVGNAIKYTERGGVLVCARRRGANAVLQVWDTGIGIAPEHIEHISEEYFQVANPARDRTKGIGLGLSIVERLVKLIDGRLSCRSRLGKGTVFEIRLPLASGLPQSDASRTLQSLGGPELAGSPRFSGGR